MPEPTRPRPSAARSATGSGRRGAVGVLRRWPTALAVGLVLLSAGGERQETVSAYGEVLPLLPLLYLVVARLRRPAASWPALVVGTAALFALQILDVVPPSLAIVAVALLVLARSAADGHLRRSVVLRVQALGMVGFSALALIGLALDPDLGRYVVAAGWFLHGVWDFVHMRRREVVASSYAEWCGVLDMLVAAELVFLA